MRKHAFFISIFLCCWYRKDISSSNVWLSWRSISTYSNQINKCTVDLIELKEKHLGQIIWIPFKTPLCFFTALLKKCLISLIIFRLECEMRLCILNTENSHFPMKYVFDKKYNASFSQFFHDIVNNIWFDNLTHEKFKNSAEPWYRNHRAM